MVSYTSQKHLLHHSALLHLNSIDYIKRHASTCFHPTEPGTGWSTTNRNHNKQVKQLPTLTEHFVQLAPVCCDGFVKLSITSILFANGAPIKHPICSWNQQPASTKHQQPALFWDVDGLNGRRRLPPAGIGDAEHVWLIGTNHGEATFRCVGTLAQSAEEQEKCPILRNQCKSSCIYRNRARVYTSVEPTALENSLLLVHVCVCASVSMYFICTYMYTYIYCIY